MIIPGLFDGLVSAAAMVADSLSGPVSAMTIATTVDSLSGPSVVSDCCTTDSSVNSGKAIKQPLIPSDVLIPPEMKLLRDMPSRMETVTSQGKSGLVIPEGRVHGGGLLSLLGGSIRSPEFNGRI